MRLGRVWIVGTLATLFAFAGALPAHADASTKRQKIEELFQLIQVQKTLQQAMSQQMAQVQTAVKTLVPGMKMTSDEQKDFDTFLQKIGAITQESMAWSKLEPQFVDLYASTYSEEEIDGMVAFYHTPTGEAMIAKQPEILSKSQVISQAQLAAVQPKIREAVMQFIQEMAAKHPKN